MRTCSVVLFIFGITGQCWEGVFNPEAPQAGIRGSPGLSSASAVYCVTLGELPNLSVPPFLFPKVGVIASTHKANRRRVLSSAGRHAPWTSALKESSLAAAGAYSHFLDGCTSAVHTQGYGF